MLDRLSLIDASLLEREVPATPLHTGGVGIFGDDLAFERVAGVLRARVGRVPLARKRVRAAGLAGGRPVWVDDADFDLSYHLRHAALPAPGSAAQLGEFLARLLSRPLDRTRPLWEMYVIEGLEDGRRAVFRKVHVAMAGGDRTDPFAVLLDDTADGPGTVEVGAGARWEPAPSPDPGQLVAGALSDTAARIGDAGREALRLAGDPLSLARAAGSAAGEAASLVARLARSAPHSPLNRPLTPHRRIAMTAADLEDLRRVRRAFGGTINDVVVALASDAVGRLLRWRGHDTTDLDLSVMVPVRVRGAEEAGSGMGEVHTPGDGVVGVLVPFPVMRMDPVARLYRIRGEMAGLKASRQAVAADALVRLAGFAPPSLHAAAARLVAGEQRYSLALSNAPGPQAPRFLAGARMLENYPFLPLAGDSALSIAVSSYAGAVYVGLVGERDAMPDLDLLVGFWHESLADLTAAAA